MKSCKECEYFSQPKCPHQGMISSSTSVCDLRLELEKARETITRLWDASSYAVFKLMTSSIWRNSVTLANEISARVFGEKCEHLHICPDCKAGIPKNMLCPFCQKEESNEQS